MKKNMRLMQQFSVLGMLLLMVFASLVLLSSKDIRQNSLKIPVAARQPVVVLELFTSQGCSSCPPADALLAGYAKAHDEHVIPISFHVDYWNRLGWTDPFSNSAYTARQQWYSQHLPNGSVYTPQLIVNGRGEAVGNNRNTVRSLVQKEFTTKQTGTISVEDIAIGKNALTFHYKIADADLSNIINIALVQKQATTNIKSGENGGRTITNHNIVRSFISQPISNEGLGLVNLPVSFKASEYSLVLYLQNKKDLLITAAVMKDLQ